VNYHLLSLFPSSGTTGIGGWHDLLSQLRDELLEEFFLAGGVVVVVGHDVAPDLNLFAGFQLEILRKFSALDSRNGTIGEFVGSLLGTVHAIEGDVCLLQHESCQRMCR